MFVDKESFMVLARRVLIVAVVGAVMGGCATTVPLEATTRTPAAAGSAKVSKDSQGNTTLDVSVKYLPRPNDLDRSLTTFVVWLVADDGARVRNLGQLNVDSNRSGSVTVVTPVSKFRLVITAEESGTVEKPSQYVILNGTVGQS